MWYGPILQGSNILQYSHCIAAALIWLLNVRANRKISQKKKPENQV